MPLDASSASKGCSVGRVDALDLLDELWFFRSMLSYGSIQQQGVRGSRKNKPGRDEVDKVVARALMRAPSLPPGVGREEAAAQEMDSSPDMSYSSTSLDIPTHPNTPAKTPKLRRSMSRPRPPRSVTKVDGTAYTLRETSLRKAFQEKKWKSLSDLEFEEVQGFKDLGFVFDDEEMKDSLLKVIPGLRGRKATDGDGNDQVRRPYLSEAWLVQWSAPPLLLGWAGKSSAEDKKEKLRSWARAVAFNVRQEC